VPYVVWVESTEKDARSGFAGFEAAKRALLRGAAGALVPGRASAEYVTRLGLPRDRVRVAPNAVDARLFRERVDALRVRRDALRRELGIERPLVLQVARLDAEKGADTLLRATAPLDVDVALAGVGQQEEALRRLAGPGTRFLGFLPADELVRWYAAADVFVLASRSEQWGMVLNEAAAAALPVVTTDAVGAAADLVEDGVSGYRVRAGDEGALRSALERLLGDEGLRASAGARSRELAAGHTPEAWADAVESLAREVVR
jgi:glycosyltransferase involved in cell wall biosynthesis